MDEYALIVPKLPDLPDTIYKVNAKYCCITRISCLSIAVSFTIRSSAPDITSFTNGIAQFKAVTVSLFSKY